jgi:GntR family transcriptional repressor for pyruvate dehydrogenase complex
VAAFGIDSRRRLFIVQEPKGALVHVSNSQSHPDEDLHAVRGRLFGLINSGAYGPHGRLPPERHLSAQFGVSRRTVRRVLEALAAEGLIWRHRGKGTFLGQPPDPTGPLAAEIVGETRPLEIMEARLCIELQLAALCAGRAGADDVDRMRRLARRVFSTQDLDLVEFRNGVLHRRIARAAGNKPLLTSFSLLDEIRASGAWRELRARARSIERLSESDRRRQAIVDAIATAQPEAAAAAMRTHLETLSGNLGMIVAQPASGSGSKPKRQRHDAATDH